MKLGRSKEAPWHSFTRWWITVVGSFQLPSFSRGQVYTQTCFLFRKPNWRLSNPVLTLRPFSLSLSFFCAGGMKNEVDRVRAGILRNRGRDASRQPLGNSNRSSTAVSLLEIAIPTISYRWSRVCSTTLDSAAFRNQKNRNDDRPTTDWESGFESLGPPFSSFPKRLKISKRKVDEVARPRRHAKLEKKFKKLESVAAKKKKE